MSWIEWSWKWKMFHRALQWNEKCHHKNGHLFIYFCFLTFANCGGVPASGHDANYCGPVKVPYPGEKYPRPLGCTSPNEQQCGFFYIFSQLIRKDERNVTTQWNEHETVLNHSQHNLTSFLTLVVGQAGIWLTPFRSVDRRSPSVANQAAVTWWGKWKAKFLAVRA